MRHPKWLVFFVGVLLLTQEGCRSRPKIIKIVSSMPRTGSANAQTTTIVNGIKMAIEEFGGKIGEFPIIYEDWDDASAKKGDWDPEVESGNALKAAANPDIMVYIGTYNSGAAKIAMPILNRANLVMISPSNTYVGLTKPNKGEVDEPHIYRPTGKITYFRVVPTDDLQGKIGAQYLKTRAVVPRVPIVLKNPNDAQEIKQKVLLEEAQAKRTVYVLDDRSLYGKGIADMFEATAKEMGDFAVLGRDGIDPKAQEYRSLMTRIKTLDPAFIYFGGTTQTNAGQIAKDMVAVGLRAHLMVPDGCKEEAFIKSAGAENLNGRVFITFGGLPPEKLTGAGAAFVARYQKKHGGMPEVYAVYGYVAARVALTAIAKAGTKDREAVRSAVAAYRSEDGDTLGAWTFDENGDITLFHMSVNTVENGAFKFLESQ